MKYPNQIEQDPNDFQQTVESLFTNFKIISFFLIVMVLTSLILTSHVLYQKRIIELQYKKIQRDSVCVESYKKFTSINQQNK